MSINPLEKLSIVGVKGVSLGSVPRPHVVGVVVPIQLEVGWRNFDRTVALGLNNVWD